VYFITHKPQQIQRHKQVKKVEKKLTSVILATQEAEIRRIVVRSQTGQIVQRLYLIKTHHRKRAGEMAQGEGPEFKPQYHKKKKKKLKLQDQNALGCSSVRVFFIRGSGFDPQHCKNTTSTK
jgi:hypothetical protein